MVGFSLENSILYRDTVAAREEQFATLTLMLSDQEALINRMRDRVRSSGWSSFESHR